MKVEREDKLISHFLESIGLWRKQIVVGGGYAPIIYRLYLANDDSAVHPVGTRDIDSLIARRVPEVSSIALSTHLLDAGFSVIFRDLNDPATEAYVKEVDGLDVEVEFLTDNAVRNHKDRNVVVAGVAAQPLSYLQMSLQSTVGFQTYSGLTGLVVSPGAWVFHKGLTFVRRRNAAKRRKDLYGIWYVLTQLGDFSSRAKQELFDLRKKRPKWFETFRDNLSSWRANASPLDWSYLEAQDPSGQLRRFRFEKALDDALTREY